MLSYTCNASQSFAQKVAKITAHLLTVPSKKGYTGACPFLRGVSSSINGGLFEQAFGTSAESQSETRYKDAAVAPGEYTSSNLTSISSSGSLNFEQCPHFKQQQQQQQQKQHLHMQSALDITVEDGDEEQHQNKCPYVTGNKRNDEQRNSDNDRRQSSSSSSSSSSFDYDEHFNKLISAKQSDGSYRVFRKVRRFSANFPHGTEQNRPVTIWCSNDYFGMSSHPRVRAAIVEALDEYGAGSGGTRNIAGNSPVHEQLEWELADLHEKEAALLFSSCYVANDSTLYTLLKLIPDCHIFSDAGNHASMIQGIRNSRAPRHVFRSFDCEDLERQLQLVPLNTPKIVAFETVHSMTGDISDVERMCDIAHQYGAITFVDEVHAVGLYGNRGAGIGQRENCMHKLDIISGTLGKAYGNCGGYIAGPKRLVDVVRSYAAGFIFTTSLPPTVASGARESVRILKGDEGRRLRAMQYNNVTHMKRALSAAGLPHFHSKSHIIPIPVRDPNKCTQVSNDLLQLGHYIQSINYPTVARGSERLRVSVSPFHNEKMIDNLIEKLVRVWSKNSLKFLPAIDVAPHPCHRYKLYPLQTIRVGDSSWCEFCNEELGWCGDDDQDSKLESSLSCSSID